MVRNLRVMVIGVVACLAALSLVAKADEVDYDEVDYRALGMAVQTEQPQGADQFIRMYSQILVFDENQYGASYSLDILESSVVAASTVGLFDESALSDDYRFFASSIISLGLHWLGYTETSEKFNSLMSIWGSLGRAFYCYISGYWSGVKTTWLCMKPGGHWLADDLWMASGLIAGFGGPIAIGVGTTLAATILAYAIAIPLAFLAVLCIAIGTVTMWKAIWTCIFGAIMLVPVKRRTRAA